MVLHITKKDEVEFNDWLKKQQAEAAAILESFGLDPRDLLSTEAGWLLCLPKYEGQLMDFDAYQLKNLTIKNRLRSLLKARQIGFSFFIACETLARCHIKEKHTAVCVSYNHDDAKEKISLIKELHEELPLQFQKKIVIDSKTEVAFASNSRSRKLSRMVSYPSKAPRGKTGDVYLDELAHCQNDKSIYAGATALITRSNGQLTIGSTPLGRRGIFHSIHTQELEKFPGYWRQEVPWWLCRHFCRDIPEAAKMARFMPTADRVALFGTAALKSQFNALPLEDFQQEFELYFQDERVSYYPYELILPCCKKDRNDIPVHSSFEELLAAKHKYGPLSLGFDVGRTKHPSELYCFEDQKNRSVMRYDRQFKNMPFPQQESILTDMMLKLGDSVKVFRIDSTGIGRMLAEKLQANRVFGRKVQAYNFTQQSKERLAVNLKIMLQEQSIVLPRDRDIISQLHCIKQKITASNNTIFDAERNRHHHADKTWAIALAVLREKGAAKKVLREIGVRVVGEPKQELILPEHLKVKTGMIEQLFPDVRRDLENASPMVPQTGLAVMRKVSMRSLKQMAKDHYIAMEIYKETDPRLYQLHFNQYKRFRREINNRKSQAVKQPQKIKRRPKNVIRRRPKRKAG